MIFIQEKMHVYIIFVGLIIACLYAILNMIKLINLVNVYNNTLFECRQVYNKRYDIINKQDKNHKDLIRFLEKKRKQINNTVVKNGEVDKFYKKEVIPFIKNNIPFENNLENINDVDNYNINNRWSYL